MDALGVEPKSLVDQATRASVQLARGQQPADLTPEEHPRQDSHPHSQRSKRFSFS
jgi:hypothetical protein